MTRLGEDAYLVVTAAAAHAQRRLDPPSHRDARVMLTDVTSALAVLGVMGPRSRAARA